MMLLNCVVAKVVKYSLSNCIPFIPFVVYNDALDKRVIQTTTYHEEEFLLYASIMITIGINLC